MASAINTLVTQWECGGVMDSSTLLKQAWESSHFEF